MHNGFAYPDAKAYVRGGGVRGEVKFYQKHGAVLVIADISGLPDNNPSGFFAFHIHEGSSCLGAGFSETKSHYNPKNAPHPQHSGDLPPLLSTDGKAYLAVLTNRFTVKEITGKTVVIHSRPDDFNSQPAGNAGTKIACGVII